jgi:hypothetical protein
LGQPPIHRTVRTVPDAISVRQAIGLPMSSFILHLAMDALGLRYSFPATGRVRDFHPLDCAHAGRTKKRAQVRSLGSFNVNSQQL